MRRLFVFVVAFWTLSVWAGSCTQYKATYDGVWRSSKTDAMNGALAAWAGATGQSTSGVACAFGANDSIEFGCFRGTQEVMSGAVETREDPNCQPDTCTTTLSKSKVTNFTVCYARGGGSLTDCATAPGHPITGGQVCMDGCAWGVGDPVTAFKSETVTSTGLYRLSVDMRVAGLGANCSGDPNPLESSHSPQATTPPCVGSLGEVNGKPYCAGTAQNPVSSDQPANLAVPPESGNPRAGDKPETGEGSGTGGAGRTPSAGDGGAAGGPGSAAGTGNTGSVVGGTVDKPADGKEQANCGAPGQPQCKIDESGTPTDASGKFNDANNKLGVAMDSIKGSIEGVKDIAAPTWTWSFQLPTGCTAVTMWEGMTIDMCQYQGTIHDLMSMIWLITTAWACIAIVGRTVGQGG